MPSASPAPRALRAARLPAPLPPQAEGQSPADRRPAAHSPPRLARHRYWTGNGYEALSRHDFCLVIVFQETAPSVGSQLFCGGRSSSSRRRSHQRVLPGPPHRRSRPASLGPERRPRSRRAGRAASRRAFRPRALCLQSNLLPRLRPHHRLAPSVGRCHGHRQPRGPGAPGAGPHPAPADREPAELGPPAEEVPVHAQRGGEAAERGPRRRGAPGPGRGPGGRERRGRVVRLGAHLGSARGRRLGPLPRDFHPKPLLRKTGLKLGRGNFTPNDASHSCLWLISKLSNVSDPSPWLGVREGQYISQSRSLPTGVQVKNSIEIRFWRVQMK